MCGFFYKMSKWGGNLPKKIVLWSFFLSICVEHLMIKIPTYFIFEFPVVLIILIHMFMNCRLRQSANQALATAFDTFLNQPLVPVSFLCTSVIFGAGDSPVVSFICFFFVYFVLTLEGPLFPLTLDLIVSTLVSLCFFRLCSMFHPLTLTLLLR